MTTAYSSLAFSISPCAKPKNKKKEEDETYMLTLAPFTRPPKISFGTVKVNESVEKSLLIVNPQDFRMELNVVNSELNINNIKLFIEKGETVALKLKWEPTKPDNYRYTINFEVLNSLKLKFVVHAYGICEKIDPKKKTAVRRPPFKVLQPIKTKKEEAENTAPPSQEKTIVMRPAAVAEQQENRATFGMEIHNRTQVIEKPKKLSYDDDFYRSEFNYTNTFIDANSTTHHSGHHLINSTTNVVNSTAMIDRRQTSVISTPKLNFYRSIDSLNVASIAEEASIRMKSPLRRSTSVREIYMEETIIKASSSLRGSSTAEDVETTIYSVPETVASLLSKQHSRSPGTPKLSDYLRTPCAKGRHWTQVHEQDRTAKYAVLCQRAIRMKRFRIRLRMLKLSLAQTTAALVIQRQWRMKIFRRRMTRFRRAAVTIQTWFRRVKAARDERRRVELERRILTERLNLFINVRSAKTIQRWYREILRRRAEFERKRLEAVLSIQSTWRMILAKRRFEVKMAAIIKIQRWFKVKRAARIERERRQAELERKRLEAVVSVQSMWRMILAKRRFEAKMTAIDKIQRWFKAKRAKRIEYERKLLIAVVLAQKRWRMICARKVYQSKLKSALLIQTIYRSKSARERFVAKKRQHLAAITLQSQWRMISARNRFRHIQRSIVLIQTWYRTNRDLKKRNHSATLIQATWRGYITRKRLVEAARREAAVVKLQSTWRMLAARRRFKNLLKSVRFIQTAFREARRRKLNASATLVQATWRGYITRKKFYAAEKERKQKLQKSSSAAASSHIPVRRSAANTDQSRTLGARIRNSLQLLTCSDASIPLPNIIYSLNDLQTVTRLSPECCEIFVRESATDILFGFIANCNRSVPHMDMIKLCLDIILNLARYSKTVGGICSDDQAAFQTLFNLLQAYQLSNSAIFMSVCVIMILLHRHGYLGEAQMASVGGREKFQFKLTSIYMALEKRRQNTRTTAATPTQSSTTRSKKYLFTLEPEWQLAKSSQSIEFVDSLNALESLLSELGMRHTMSTSSSAVVSSTSVRRPIPRRDAQTPVSAVGTHTYSTRSTAAAASSRKIEYAEIDEHTIICNDNNASVLSNVTIRGFNEEPHLNSTRNHQ